MRLAAERDEVGSELYKARKEESQMPCGFLLSGIVPIPPFTRSSSCFKLR